MQVAVEDVERLLGRVVPVQYRALVARSSLQRLDLTAAAPAQIAAVNLEQRAEGADGPSRFGFALYSSDGDCLLVRDGDESGMVFEWSHETREVTSREFLVTELLERLSTLPIKEIDAEDPTVILSRVTPWPQSILDPIQFSELVAVAAKIPGVSCFECLEGTNPFTGEAMRFEVPGLQIDLPASEPLVFKLQHGRLYEPVESRPIPELIRRVARHLGADVFAHCS